MKRAVFGVEAPETFKRVNSRFGKDRGKQLSAFGNTAITGVRSEVPPEHVSDLPPEHVSDLPPEHVSDLSVTTGYNGTIGGERDSITDARALATGAVLPKSPSTNECGSFTRAALVLGVTLPAVTAICESCKLTEFAATFKGCNSADSSVR